MRPCSVDEYEKRLYEFAIDFEVEIDYKMGELGGDRTMPFKEFKELNMKGTGYDAFIELLKKYQFIE